MDEKTTPKPEVKKAVEAEVAPETKPEPIVIKAEPAAPLLEVKDAKGETLLKVEEPKAPEPEKVEEPKAPEPAKAEVPKAPEPAPLFSVKTNAYSAWVTQNGEKSYLANLEVGGSTYNWPAGSTSEAEALLKYHIANQKL